MLLTCYVPGEEIKNHREFLRHRLGLVKMRTQVKNRIHSLLDIKPTVLHLMDIPIPTEMEGKVLIPS